MVPRGEGGPPGGEVDGGEVDGEEVEVDGEAHGRQGGALGLATDPVGAQGRVLEPPQVGHVTVM